MKINYCLPIIKKSKRDVLQTLSLYENEYQFFEVWLAEIIDLDKEFIKSLYRSYPDKIIFLFQRGNDNNRTINNNKKEQILELFHTAPCLLDLDLSESTAIQYLKKNYINVKTIISYHNYLETPLNLGEIIKKMDTVHPAIYKISVQCTDKTDALKLLLLQQNLKKQEKRHIILGMGELGKITRVFGTLWGNELIYAPVSEKEASAPGQLTKQTLEEIFQRLL